MSAHIFDRQKARIAGFLANERTCIISSVPSQGVWVIPVWYRPANSLKLEVDCLVPRWSDVAHQLTKSWKVLLIIQASSSAYLQWVQIQGTARLVETPDWDWLLPNLDRSIQPDSLYLVVRVTPTRIDLVDEDLGWGIQETIEW